MKTTKSVNVILVGTRFGECFVPIYQAHPDCGEVAICDTDEVALGRTGERFNVQTRFNSLESALKDKRFNAVHLVTPIPCHARQAVAVLRSGRHCACTVPMATSLKDIQAVIKVQRKSKKNYMMMETAAYTRHMFHAWEMLRKGEIGAIQFLRGAHYQDMENWPAYWNGLPPMWYATHALAPLLALANCAARKVHCFGSGTLRAGQRKTYGNPFPVETAIFQLEKPNLSAEVTRTLFSTARGYTESFSVYGNKAGFEWEQLEKAENPIVFRLHRKLQDKTRRGLPVTHERVEPRDRQDLLPPEIARFTVASKYDETNPQKSFHVGGGHGGSHPHLVHEFVRSIVENRKPWINEKIAADWTAAGICAHESAMNGGRMVMIPQYQPRREEI
jgi:predicted dehydrogenase